MKHTRICLIILFVVLIIGNSYSQTNIPEEIFHPNPSSTPSSIPAPPSYNVDEYGPAFNYVRTWIPRAPLTTLTGPLPVNVGVSTDYKNGFGDVIQSISHGGLGQTDIIKLNNLTPGKEHYNYLPYADERGTKFRMNGYSDQDAYNGNVYPDELGYNYTKSFVGTTNQITYAHSYSAGASFAGVDFGQTVHKTNNDNTYPEEKIYMWRLQWPSLEAEATGWYPDNELTVTHYTADKHGPYTKVFTDKDGKVICKKVSDGTSWLATYYVYDHLGKIVWIIPPKAAPVTSTFPYVLDSAVAYGLCYYYKYDRYGQVIEKWVPDRGSWEKTVYDKFHRPVLYQNGILSSQNKWQFTLYDQRFRQVATGVFTELAGNNREFWQERVLETSGWTGPSTYQPLVEYLRTGVYVTAPASISNCEINTKTFYDSYDNIPMALQNLSFVPYPNDYVYGNEVVTPSLSYNTKDMVVGTSVRVLGSSTNTWINTKFFYDHEGKVIQTQTLNPWNGNNDYDINTTQYDFSGNVVLNVAHHKSWSGTNKASTKVCTKYSYNYFTGNLYTVKQKIDSDAYLPIAQYTYDSMNRVKEKLLGNVESQKYTYNIRGQLTGINSGYVYDIDDDIKHTFGEMICYDYGFEQKRFDGKIAGYIYRGAGKLALPRAYGYLYDPAGRLTMGDFYERWDPNSPPPIIPLPSDWDKMFDYTAYGITYDKNGNLTQLKQMGVAYSPGGGSYANVSMDKLVYTYNSNSNRLYSVYDSVGTNYNLHDFIDGNIESQDYDYDENGNLSMDLNKGITSIQYNYMDLPTTIQTANGSITKLYDATGNLLEKITVENSVSDTERYWGPFVYKNSNLSYLLHEEGRTRYLAPQAEFQNDFFVKDHLGNVRNVVRQDVTLGYPDEYESTWELLVAAAEELIFDPLGPIRATKPQGNPGDLQCGLLDGQNSNERIGAAILLHCMAGDELEVGVFGYHESDGPFDTYTMPQFMLESLSTAMIGGTGEGGEGGPLTTTINNLLTGSNYNAYEVLKQSVTDPAYPRAYLNVLVFDEAFNLLPDYSKVAQLKGGANSWTHMSISNDPLPIGANGYVLSYISNESHVSVWVDNGYTRHYKGVLLEEQHYYPHGLTIDLADEGTQPENDYLHQTKKLERALGVELYDFHARQYDPQIGRFWGVDMLDQFPSGYTGMGNDPANMIDPSGMWADPIASDYSDEPGDSDFIPDLIDGPVYDEFDAASDSKAADAGKTEAYDTNAEDESGSGDGETKKTESITAWLDNSLESTVVGRAFVITITEFNSCCNPLYLAVDGIYGLTTGTNMVGQPVEWTQSTANLLSAVPISKLGTVTYEISQTAVSTANRYLAARYLAKQGQLDNFVEGTARFQLQLGTQNYVYHEAIEAAAKTRFSTPTLYRSSTSAWNKLGLGYERSTNSASHRFKTINIGFFVNGTVKPQGRSIGFGIQNYRTGLGFRTNPQQFNW